MEDEIPLGMDESSRMRGEGARARTNETQSA